MSFKDIEYQTKAINNLIEATDNLLVNRQPSPVIAFKAPTGSGKTVMTAKYIQKLCSIMEDNICFIWVSIGQGELHKQSKLKLENIFEGFPKVSLLGEEFFGFKKEIERNEVVVVNWESINNKDREGNYTNVLMRDGEKINFRQVLHNTREAGKKIFLIIDESHFGASTERANELRDEIKANITLEMSATPKLIPSQDDVLDYKAAYVRVRIEEVIKEEMIKKQIIINEGLTDIAERTIDRRLLESAYEKREELKSLLEVENSNVNPLVIVQLPNGEEGERKKDTVIEFLKEKDISIDNGKLAIWLDNEKENLDNITDNTNSVEFLIFKQAIDTGWDCPRAQVLVRFRDSQSEVFARQTLGRILRMPEQKHYVDDKLNKAYIYTDYTGNVLSIIDNEFDYPIGRIRPIPLQKRENIENIKLSREFIHRRRKNIVKETVQASFNEMIESLGFIKGDYEHNVNILEDNGFELDISKLQENIIGELEIESRDLLTIDDISGEEVNIEIDEERTEVLFRRLLWKHSRALGNNRDILFNVLRESIYEFFYDYIVRFMEDSDYIVKIQKLFVLNYRFFNKLIIDVINKYNELKEDDINEITVYTESVYKLPIKININPEVYEKVEIGQLPTT